MHKVKIIGYEEFTSKKGTNCVIISVVSDIKERESHIACVGQKAVSYFVPTYLKSKISANDVGKEITIYTTIKNDIETLVDIIE